MNLISYRSHPTALRYLVGGGPTTTLWTLTQMQQTLGLPFRRSDDKLTDLFGAILIIKLSVISTAGADLDANIDNVTVHQADHGDMLFQ